MSANQKRYPFGLKAQYVLGFNQQDDEIGVDFFCGGGGAGTGLEMSLGRAITVAKNHSPAAISMQTVNHLHAKHFTLDVFEGDLFALSGATRPALTYCAGPTHNEQRQPATKSLLEKAINNYAYIPLVDTFLQHVPN